MLTKEKYNQQDIDYAFSLEHKEREGDVESEMLEEKSWYDSTMSGLTKPNASASGTYQMLIMKGVFGGMKDRFTQKFQSEREDDAMFSWLSDDASNCIINHKKEMKMILRGLKHSTKDPDKKKLQDGFSELLTRWMFQLFHDHEVQKTYSKMVRAVTDPKGKVIQEANKIISHVLKHDDLKN